MPQKTHYQDDLFVLSLLVKTLDASLSVEADPEFFREKTLGDVMFLDSTLKRFGEMLAQNSHLIERLEYLKLLERTAKAFVGCLDRLISGKAPMTEAYEDHREAFIAMQRGHRALVAELGTLLSEEGTSDGETDLVSSDELNELLRGV